MKFHWPWQTKIIETIIIDRREKVEWITSRDLDDNIRLIKMLNERVCELEASIFIWRQTVVDRDKEIDRMKKMHVENIANLMAWKYEQKAKLDEG